MMEAVAQLVARVRWIDLQVSVSRHEMAVMSRCGHRCVMIQKFRSSGIYQCNTHDSMWSLCSSMSSGCQVIVLTTPETNSEGVLELLSSEQVLTKLYKYKYKYKRW